MSDLKIGQKVLAQVPQGYGEEPAKVNGTIIGYLVELVPEYGRWSDYRPYVYTGKISGDRPPLFKEGVIISKSGGNHKKRTTRKNRK